LNDPIAEHITELLKIPEKEIKHIAGSVVSIKVKGVKTHDTTHSF
jgi:hypothetical protein